jgi:hypothetical protein
VNHFQGNNVSREGPAKKPNGFGGIIANTWPD